MTIFRLCCNFAFASVLLAFGGSLACGSSNTPPETPVEDLPPYTAQEAALFDDTVAPAAYGLPQDLPPERDRVFYDRLHRADAVVFGRIATVTEEALAGKQGYSLAIAVERTHKGSLGSQALELRVPLGGRGLARMEVSSSALIGKHVLVFVRTFARSGEREIHWHAEADDAATRRALQRPKPLDENAPKEHTGKS